MKKSISVSDAKTYVENLVGQNVNVKLNRGRNKIKRYQGKVSEAYDNVFVVELYNDLFDRISCSYSDMVCGEITLDSVTP